MTSTPRVVLRYFDARGRAQFLRYYLSARGIDYADERTPVGPDFSHWLALRGDRSAVGPFHKLPVLTWSERKLAETMVIQAFLHRALGDEALLTDDENLQHAMLVSSLYNDVMMPIGILLWSEALYPGVELGAIARRTFDRLRGHFGAVDATLGEWRWNERATERPIMTADCLLWEELDVMRYLFGDLFRVDDYPQLALAYRGNAVRAVSELQLGRRTPVTGLGLAAEDAVIAKLRALVAA